MILFAGSKTKDHAKHVLWLQRQLGYSRGWDESNTVSMGVYKDGLCAVVVYHDWTPEHGTICMSAASLGPWLDREVLYEMHAYPFHRAECQAVVLQVSEKNKRMLRIAKSFGYELTRVPRLRGPDEAEVICVLTREAWEGNRFTRAFLRNR